MARPLRIEYENAVYHITARGNERKNIFLDEQDYEKFLFYLDLMHRRYKIIVYCYTLMGNHYHLLIETPQPNLSRMMHDLNGHYTIFFNRRHKRYGHLFQGRYKAILVDKDNYLLELSRYIHLNPIRGHIVSKPEDYKYSSISYYIGKNSAPPWLDAGSILQQFGNTIRTQQDAYKKFAYDGIVKSVNPLKNIYANAILGSEDFIKTITNKFLSKKDISNQVPKGKELKFGKDLKEIARVVTECYNTDKAILIKRKVKFNNSKKTFIYLARKYTDSNLRQITDFLHNTITEVAVSKSFSRTVKELKKSQDVKREIEKVERCLLAFAG